MPYMIPHGHSKIRFDTITWYDFMGKDMMLFPQYYLYAILYS